jgi:hypothetical protein
VKRIGASLPLILLLGAVPLLQAQGPFNVAIGFGSVHDKATGSGIDPNTLLSCSTATDSICENTPALGRLFMGLEGDALLTKHVGIGADFSFQPSKGDYGPLQYRQIFYDFNGIYAPISHKKAQLRLEGGIGGTRSGFSYLQSACVGTAVCTTQSESVGTSGHFQVHLGAGVQVYLTKSIFIRPQFDFHQAPGLTNQFGSNHVIGGTVWIGYNFGEM